ncbi:unnamed protein product [Cylindrotheca closterium]|uniref:Fe2OG dioxygenase domain-containing protein n=1 Tax=Cylindrotheca closterium TaxID=2856 RepID=A0AAD2CA72_9STRA|nr:unnamed protein product [Cylindrotheca closterium]
MLWYHPLASAIVLSLNMVKNRIPLVNLPSDNDSSSEMMRQAARQVSEALETSGFLLVQSHYLSKDLQQDALVATKEILNDKDNSETILHPVDPKKYIMIQSADSIETLKAKDDQQKILKEYWDVMEKVKHQVLHCISLGLGLPPGYFSECHSKSNSCLRLLHYPPVPEESSSSLLDENISSPKIRCKAHSDYGSVTLLTSDGVGGLQAMIDGVWTDVPYVEGTIVVNIGSLLSDWTKGKLLSTLHRVVSNDKSSEPRTSIAFFADPDGDISASLGNNSSERAGMTVKEYIQYRAGGDNRGRVGVAFTSDETNRAEGESNKE